jgi:hypothetical protein
MNLKELIKQLTNEALNENKFNSMSTMEKLIKQAEKDGYIFGDYGQYILDAARIVAKGFDALSPEEQKVMRDTYYKAFLRKIGKVNETSGSGDAGGYPSKFFLKKKVQEYSNFDQKAKYQASKPTTNTYGGPSLATKGGGYYASAIKENMNNTLIDIIKEELLNEVTYSKFKNEVKNRTKAEQLHKAIREVKRKLQEIDRIVEYTSRMKEELSEGDGIQYWNRTNEAVKTISEMVNVLNNKIKNLQQ